MNWLRLYHSALSSAKVQQLPDREFKAWVNMLMVASQNTPRGSLPPPEDLAFSLRLRADFVIRLLTKFTRNRLVDDVNGVLFMHDWTQHQFESDDVNQRVAKHRMSKCNVSSNVACNPPDTEQIQNREETTPIPPSQATGVVREITPPAPPFQKDFSEFWDSVWLKTGKDVAFRAYSTRRKAGVSREVLLTAAKSQGPYLTARALQESRTPIHPATWINQGRYLDEEAAYKVRDGPKAVTRFATPLDRKAVARMEFEQRMLREMEDGRQIHR
jgi:hypothetical protein